MSMNTNPSLVGGLEANVNKIEISDDAFGLGTAISGIAKEIRKGGEGLLDKADKIYSLKHTLFPVRSAKQEAKALAISIEAIEATSNKLFGSGIHGISDEIKVSAQMMLADYVRKYTNINNTLQKALPMIFPEADTNKIDDDWLSSAFDYIGGVSQEELQEMWARLLAQEANRPDTVSKRAFIKLSMLDLRNAHTIKKLLEYVISVYTPSICTEESRIGFHKIGRFSLPMFQYLNGVYKPSDNLAWNDAYTHRMGRGIRTFSWLIDEYFFEELTPTFFVDNNLHKSFFGGSKIGIRFNYGPLYLCSLDQFKKMIIENSNNGACSIIFQLTDIAEDLLEPRIYLKQNLRIYNHNKDSFEAKIEKLLELEEIKVDIGGFYDNPGFLLEDNKTKTRNVKFYYH